jgi:hypothetical protein
MENEGLNAFRGIIWGVVFGVSAWVLIGAIAAYVYWL